MEITAKKEKDYETFLKKVSEYVYANKDLIPSHQIHIFNQILFHVLPYSVESCPSCSYIGKFLHLLEQLAENIVSIEEFKREIKIPECEHKFTYDLKRYTNNLKSKWEVGTMLYYLRRSDLSHDYKRRIENIQIKYKKTYGLL